MHFPKVKIFFEVSMSYFLLRDLFQGTTEEV